MYSSMNMYLFSKGDELNNTHVFIVNTTTFKYHLEYMFAGTGAKELSIDFNGIPTSTLGNAENMLAGMMADVLRVRRGDRVIFYVQGKPAEGFYEGKFFGVFKAKDGIVFLDNFDKKEQYLYEELGKSLTFRTLLEPAEVYAEGITEWETLDSIDRLDRPYEMQWSLIYRKLKANRGNTMITPHEFNRILHLLREKNNNEMLTANGFTFDVPTQKIGGTDGKKDYTGRKEQIDLIPRIRQKYLENKAFEAHLQAYIVQNIGKNTNASLDRILLGESNLDWLGNEVFCGVGMQKIDVLLETSGENGYTSISPLELKAVNADKDAIRQIKRYIEWLKQYYIPNKDNEKIVLKPAIIGRKYDSVWHPQRQELIRELKEYESKQGHSIAYVEYYVDTNGIHFTTVSTEPNTTF